jgi:hypothetical protein
MKSPWVMGILGALIAFSFAGPWLIEPPQPREPPTEPPPGGP